MPRTRSRFASLLLTLPLLAGGCSSLAIGDVEPDTLAFDESALALDNQADGSTSTTSPPIVVSTTTEPLPVPLGSLGDPFAPLPESDTPRAVRTPSGIALAVLGRNDDRFMIMTACENVAFVDESEVEPIGRAHVVLDAGHGGTEVGAVGPAGTIEKDINLAVAVETKRLLEAAGATVVMTRGWDHNITTGARGLLAKSIDPALFVSIHHNGGAPRTGSEPGTIVFAKGLSATSTRFGGLFHQRLNTMLDEAAAGKQQRYQIYADALAAHEARVAEYDASVMAREAALVANGQLPASATTTPPEPPRPVDGIRLPSERIPATTTTMAAPTAPTNPDGSPVTNADGSPQPAPTTVPVPDTIAPPEPFTSEPVREFAFAGGPNAGVRAWIRSDGKDYLSVLRHSGDVPSALTEFLYVTNPSEEELLIDPAFLAAEGRVLAEAIIDYFSSPTARGDGFVDDQFDDQPIGGGGKPSGCVEPDYGLRTAPEPVEEPGDDGKPDGAEAEAGPGGVEEPDAESGESEHSTG